MGLLPLGAYTHSMSEKASWLACDLIHEIISPAISLPVAPHMRPWPRMDPCVRCAVTVPDCRTGAGPINGKCAPGRVGHTPVTAHHPPKLCQHDAGRAVPRQHRAPPRPCHAVDQRPTHPSKLPCKCGCSQYSGTTSTDVRQLVGVVAATSADASCACRMWRASLEHGPPWTSPPCRIVARGSPQGKEKCCCDG